MASFIDSATYGARAYAVTHVAADTVTAGAWGAFINSITGSYPEIVDNGDKTVTIVFSESQAKQMRSWLDDQIYAKTKPSVSVALGPVLTPWALKYIVPAAVVLLLIGFAGGRLIKF